ncbi:hypothetical protein [Rhizobium tumorigenes]|uniref:hypothetical protein n=1 Tax=Rhizobium tumorigenes TaxID=2041385 RepID=UPI00241CF8CE|nr:hypothetical protein [Rhizobium tumorigenes]WFS02754.1 hypothetical protein PR016_09205 [Rhizobium tumorigenes]
MIEAEQASHMIAASPASPGHAGPGMWIRIQHRFGARFPEWQLAVITALWGLVLLLPGETFDQPTWAGFRAVFGNEGNLGAIMIFLGLLRIAGLIVNGARKTVTPWIRVVSASAGLMIFSGIVCVFALSGVYSTWLAIYPVFAVTEIVNMQRAARDAGESHGTA